MRGVWGQLVVLLGWVIASRTAWGFSASYDQQVTQGDHTYAAQVTIKDHQFRIESTVEGVTSVTIRTHDGIVYNYLPQEGMAMTVPMPVGVQQPIEAGAAYTQYLQEHQAQLLRTETLDGHLCEVYRLTDPQVGGVTTAWVWKEQQFPIRLEITQPAGQMVVRLMNIRFEISAPNSFFELPAGVEVMDAGSMMKDVTQQLQGQ